jgi:hypothetical protein
VSTPPVTPPADEIEDPSSSGPSRLVSILRPVAVLLVFAVILFVAFRGRETIQAVRDYRAKSLVSKAEVMIEDEDWDAAAQIMGDAHRWSSQEPAVLRTLAKLLRMTGNDPASQAQFLRQLIDQGKATPEDRFQYGTALIGAGDLQGAKKALEALPPAEREKREGLELLARIFSEEGRVEEGTAILRRALQSDASNPQSRLRLAILDHEVPFEESRKKAHAAIWDIARGKDATALLAIAYLATSNDLTTVEAQELREVVSQHPDAAGKHRLAVLSAYMRLFPTSREQILKEETDKNQGKGVEDMTDLLRWLAQENQHQRILALVPRSMAVRSPAVFPLYAEALKAESRWAELRDMIQSPSPPPISQGLAYALLAECNAKLDPTLQQTRQNIVSAYRGLQQGRDFQTILRVARIAESNGMWDLAIEGYNMASAKNPLAKVAMSEKIYEIESRKRDGAAMITATKKTIAARPNVRLFEDRLNYLCLIMGSEVELASNRLLSDTPGDLVSNVAVVTADPFPRALLRALAAYRIGDMDLMAREISQLEKPDRLAPGPRAVAAGLLRIAGQQKISFELAETTDRRLLLDAELAFLSRALQ